MKRANKSVIGTLIRTAANTTARSLSSSAKPKTVQWSEDISNSASFVGIVTKPVQRFNTHSFGQYGATTTLFVNVPHRPSRSFSIYLKMWGEMADVSLEHIKQKDFIHVTGRVESYSIKDDNNVERIIYELNVKEINYVAKCEHSPTSEQTRQLGLGGESAVERSSARLRLWQLLFANPSEWDDFRTKKVSRKHPDFKHKDTDESLWIRDCDPPWVKTQLQLLDSNSKKQDKKENSTSTFSSFV